MQLDLPSRYGNPFATCWTRPGALDPGVARLGPAWRRPRGRAASSVSLQFSGDLTSTLPARQTSDPG